MSTVLQNWRELVPIADDIGEFSSADHLILLACLSKSSRMKLCCSTKEKLLRKMTTFDIASIEHLKKQR